MGEKENKIPYVNRVVLREYKDGKIILLKTQGNNVKSTELFYYFNEPMYIIQYFN